MPALNFERRFVEAILSGRKTSTLRLPRKRPIKVGDRLYLYTGMRTKYCRKVMETTTMRVTPITMSLSPSRFEFVADAKRIDLESLAASEGFDSPADMERWFRRYYFQAEHQMLRIQWGPE